jgi:hypothetical protein
MTSEDLAAARERLGMNPGELADELAVAEAEVRGWEAGTVRIPRRVAGDVAFRVAVAEQDAALRDAGLPDCPWVVEWDAEPDAPTPEAEVARLERFDEHAAACAVCLARERYAEEHLPPLPSPPMPAGMRFWMAAALTLERLPAWARPAAAGAALLFAISAIRAVFLLPRLVRDPRGAGTVVAALAAASAAGAAGGLVYSAVRPAFRRLGRPGDYLTGVVCVTAYLGSLAAVAPVAFGEPMAETRSDWMVLLAVCVFFGLVVGHSWFRSPPQP